MNRSYRINHASDTPHKAKSVSAKTECSIHEMSMEYLVYDSCRFVCFLRDSYKV